MAEIARVVLLQARIEEALRVLRPCRLDKLPPIHVEALGQSLEIAETARQVLRGKRDFILEMQISRRAAPKLPGLERRPIQSTSGRTQSRQRLPKIAS